MSSVPPEWARNPFHSALGHESSPYGEGAWDVLTGCEFCNKAEVLHGLYTKSYGPYSMGVLLSSSAMIDDAAKLVSPALGLQTANLAPRGLPCVYAYAIFQ